MRQIRKEAQIPIVLYIYYNLVHRYGLEAFAKDSAQAGVDGVLVLDLPPEESAVFNGLLRKSDLCPICLIAPTTPENRISKIVKNAVGFIYYVSREGVTGMQKMVASNISEMTARIRQYSDLPVAVGFGISSPEQAKLAASQADAVVVGSAVVNQIAKHGGSAGLISHVAGFVSSMVTAVKQ